MRDTGVLLEAARLAADVVDVKRRAMLPEMRRAVSRSIHVKQTEETERRLAKALAPVFVEQFREMAEGLGELAGEKSYDDSQYEFFCDCGESISSSDFMVTCSGCGKKSTQDTAAGLVSQVFNPDDPKWHDKIVDAALPALAVGMAEAAVAHLMALGFDIRKGTKQTTASRWLAEHPGDIEKLEQLLAESGLDASVLTELPSWMKQNISDQLTETFAQPYWKDIHLATAGDAEDYLRRGLEEGWSIRRMADAMSQSFQGGTGKYAQVRATRIARTESGHALNSARKASLDGLLQDLPPEAADFIRPSWLSVLSNTTRDTHAALDGVPADDNGLWNLAGTLVPWPGHVSLPAGERINCMCSISTEFGLGKDEARQMIQDYEQRTAEPEQ